MSNHRVSVYNNNCLKIPRNPKSKRPFAIYEQKYINQLQNEVKKFQLESLEYKMKTKRPSTVTDTQALKSFLEFFESIPDYDEINHLSNREFYKKLDSLKERQKSFYDCLKLEYKAEHKDTEWIEDYKKLSLGDKKLDDCQKRKPAIKPFCTTPVPTKPPKILINDELDSGSLSDKETTPKPPSRRSVRIVETPSDKLSPEVTPEPYFRPKSILNTSSAGSKEQNVGWEDVSVEDLKFDSQRDVPSESKSVPNSPTKNKQTVGWKDCGITIPKPFQMTVRDEETKIVDEIMAKSNLKQDGEKSKMFKANPVPLESQIPLYDKIVADQEYKSYLIRKKSKAALEAQMRPFSFTIRDEELQSLNKRLSKSSPCILTEEPTKTKLFKAKPIPKNLFSNYVYKKMHEDEFYRAIQKKIRAEEMLKASALPPSMAKRERTKPKYDVCPRSYRDLDLEDYDENKTGDYKTELDREFEELKNEFIVSPRPYRKTLKRGDKKAKKTRNSSASSKSSCRTLCSADMHYINRSNLAAVLRIQYARKRLENEMARRLEEVKIKEEARWREKLMRKKPVWQALAYSHEDDLEIRLQQRKDEEKLRNEEHKLRMEMMLGRVSQQPTLFERQSQVKYPKSKEDILQTFYKDCKLRKSRRSLSDLSDIRSYTEMKDEAIQAFLEENCMDCGKRSDKERNSEEEKEKSDSISIEEIEDKCE